MFYISTTTHLDKLLLGVLSVFVGILHVRLHRQHLLELRHDLREEGDENLVVVRHRDGRDLREALERHVAEHGHVEELHHESVDQLRLKDVAQRDPEVGFFKHSSFVSRQVSAK